MSMDDSMADRIGEHVPRMYRVAHRMLADADRAGDVVQNACVKALANLGRFDGRSALATWLHRITVNCAKDAMRSDTRYQAAQEGLVSAAAAGDQPASPAQVAETSELAGIALQMLDGLPEDCRNAFALTQLDGYSYDEAAEIEGQPRGTIASRVFRAKRVLLEQMSSLIDGRMES